jgi:hypothetical protein
MRLNLLLATMFQRMFTTGVLNLEPDESYFANVPGITEAELLLATMFQWMFTRGVLNLHCRESHLATVPGIIEAEPFAGHHVPEDVYNRNVEPSL